MCQSQSDVRWKVCAELGKTGPDHKDPPLPVLPWCSVVGYVAGEMLIPESGRAINAAPLECFC